VTGADSECVDRATARSLAGGGALLTVVSLLTPWYVLRAGSLVGLGKSGAAALGGFSFVFVALAIGAGWSRVARVHRLLPPVAASGLVLIVLVKLASPPAAASALLPTMNDAESQLASGFANALTAGLGLHYGPAWGIWLAAVGAAATFAGTIGAAKITRGRRA
jgi:hypothetical protein